MKKSLCSSCSTIRRSFTCHGGARTNSPRATVGSVSASTPTTSVSGAHIVSGPGCTRSWNGDVNWSQEGTGSVHRDQLVGPARGDTPHGDRAHPQARATPIADPYARGHVSG